MPQTVEAVGPLAQWLLCVVVTLELKKDMKILVGTSGGSMDNTHHMARFSDLFVSVVWTLSSIVTCVVSPSGNLQSDPFFSCSGSMPRGWFVIFPKREK